MSYTIKICHGLYDGVQFVSQECDTLTTMNYPVPLNYASKSLLVAGDRLKLMVSSQGKISYKLIKPTLRKHIKWVVYKKEGEYIALWSDDQHYKLNTAAVVYYKCKIGDDVSLVINASESMPYATIEWTTTT